MAYRNDPEVARYQGWEGISEPEARAFLQEQKEIQPVVPGHWFQIAVELKETGMLVGDCALKIEEYNEHQAEIGYTLSRAYQGRGIASEAVSYVLEYAFVTLRLHRVIAITACENAASVALLERLGLRREGHFRQGVWLKGKWRDEFLYTMLQEEWRSMRSANNLCEPMSMWSADPCTRSGEVVCLPTFHLALYEGFAPHPCSHI